MSSNELVQIAAPLLREGDEFRPRYSDTFQMTECLELAHEMHHLSLNNIALMPYPDEICEQCTGQFAPYRASREIYQPLRCLNLRMANVCVSQLP